MKQDKENKLTTAFNSVPHTVINKTGNSLIVEAPSGAQYSRNTSFVKRFIEPTEPAIEAEPEIVVDNLFGDTTDYNCGQQDQAITPHRSQRSAAMPKEFADYSCK